uniref:Bud22 domain-containing protein n=1 Tax=Globisporangium ultimum (strain ATCC 200006 / CBS 805.95 / DAOM BR144) TaxID=431595 RepID=K3WNF7_GLOUD
MVTTTTKKLAGKRKRQEFSEQDKFFHKSAVLLQREAKKVRAFEVRKLVQQLKQTRAQLAAAEKLQQQEPQENVDDAAKKKLAEKLAKKIKQLQKIQLTVARLEKELEVLKALDLKAIIARAMDKTGLEKKKQQEQLKKRAEQEKQQQKKVQAELSDEDDEDDDMRQRRLLADESDDGGSDDDGFNSEDYETNANGGSVQQGDESETDSDRNEDDDEGMDEDTADAVKTEAAPAPADASADANDAVEEKRDAVETKQKDESKTDGSMQNVLIDRILAHKQLRPLLDAIEKVIEKQDREEEKKLRKQEKKALKRDRNEVLIGGRSAAAPSSLFLGSLSGRGGVIDDDDDAMMTMGSAYMDGADDDIAEFLGETKKKKNRMGQNARRQKAIRMEEAAKRKADRENGIFRPFAPRNDDKSKVSKYGPSERPKKSKKQAAEAQAKNKTQGAPGKSADRRSERGAPATKSHGPAAAAVRAPPPAPAEPSHPSWIAKQALKEKEKASLSAFSGKKITFGDD